jgi:hypothetical protein
MERIPGTARPSWRGLGRSLLSASFAATLAAVALCLIGAAGLLGMPAPAARADGDPASDALIAQNLFVGWNSGVSFSAQMALGNFVTSANRRGLPIRVALIGAPGDLGSITELWRKPVAYASFLGVELSLIYRQRLLIVMPSGFGLNWPGHSTAAAYRALARIHVSHGATGLVAATETAVRVLAASAGVSLTEPTRSAAARAGSADEGASGSLRLLAGLVAATVAVAIGTVVLALLVARWTRGGQE